MAFSTRPIPIPQVTSLPADRGRLAGPGARPDAGRRPRPRRRAHGAVRRRRARARQRDRQRRVHRRADRGARRPLAEVVLPLLPRQGRAAARAARGRQPASAHARSPHGSAQRENRGRRAARVRDRAVRARSSESGQLGYAGVLVREHRRLSEHYPLELRVALAPLVELLAEHIAAATDTPRSAPRRRDDVPRDPAGHRRRRGRPRRRRARAGRVPLALLLAGPRRPAEGA